MVQKADARSFSGVGSTPQFKPAPRNAVAMEIEIIGWR
jgi:hypothetical protein